MVDIVPELLEEIQKLFKKNFESNKKISSLLKLSEDGKATYKDAQEFAYVVGNILADVFKDKISSDILPDGKIYHNIAKRILESTLKNNHHIAADYAAKVQDIINKKAKIGIKAVEPELNRDKIDGLIQIVSNKEYDEVAYVLDEPVVNFTQTVVDDTVKANAKFHYEAGLSPKIRRISTGKCCEWCNRLAGTYNYKDVSDTGNDVFRRHKNCRCVVEFLPGKGKAQNVHTKMRYQAKPDQVDKSEKAFKRTKEEAKELQDKLDEKLNKNSKNDILKSGKEIENRIKLENNLDFIFKIVEHPKLLSAYTPRTLKKELEIKGYNVKTLGKGSLKGRKFEDGGGYRVNFGGDGIFQYHPAENSHHGGEYYKINRGNVRRKWYDMDGDEIDVEKTKELGRQVKKEV